MTTYQKVITFLLVKEVQVSSTIISIEYVVCIQICTYTILNSVQSEMKFTNILIENILGRKDTDDLFLSIPCIFPYIPFFFKDHRPLL